MVDLDQCTHATINGCDKKRRGWYLFPISFSLLIFPPFMPIVLPGLIVSPFPHLHLDQHPVRGGLGEQGASIP